MTDALTGLHNRGHLFELARQEFSSAHRYRRPLAAVIFDVDRFKQINDAHGHSVGDEVLVVAVDRCRTTLREVDVFGRYGGEEFVIVMPETALDQARVVAERLREGVAAEPVPTSEGPIDVSISIGLAHISQGVDSLTALLDRADAALLTAKRAGRNQVRG